MKKSQMVSLVLLSILAGAYLPQTLVFAQTADEAVVANSAEEVPSQSEENDDLDHNGLPDSKEDKNRNGLPDNQEDTNKNGLPDDMEEESTAAAPSSSAEVPDSSEVAGKETSEESPAASGSNQEIPSSSELSSSTSTGSQTESSTTSPGSQTDSSTTNPSEQIQTKASSSKKPLSPKARPKASTSSKLESALPQESSLGSWPGNPFASDSLSSEEVAAIRPPSYTAYVEHWSGKDAYSHNLLAHRYGIRAQQLDGYLNSLGIAYDHQRLNGTLVLQWEKESGLDARAIIAIALAESSLGTAGVATLPGSNMFGYGAFGSNPVNAAQFSDSVAVKKMAEDTIIHNKNWTFQIQDRKAKKNALGQLDPVADGGVYFTDTSGTGKRRAQIMEDIDTWIDQHGGTPAIPDELKNLGGASSQIVPTGYQISQPMSLENYVAASYPWGQCTWYVYNRAQELGYHYSAYMGNGSDWQYQSGYETTHTPKVGYALSFMPGQAGADAQYGHVAIVEQVKDDGSILISESNALGLGVVSYRTFSSAQAQILTYVIGQK